MREVFADTSYWIALLNSRDALHETAKHVSNALGAVSVVTTELVLVEVLNDYADRGRVLRAGAADLVVRLKENRRTQVVALSGDQFRAALQLYRDRMDKQWSLTDCASCLVMRAAGIGEALTHDRHFEQMGFAALLRG